MSDIVELRHEGGVALVVMNDAGTGNALGEEMVLALRKRLTEASASPETRVVLLLGGEDVFCSGAPQQILIRLAKGEISPADVALAAALLDVPFPTIAAMQGHATGGGLALGLCADIVLMARESRYGATFMNMGFTPGMGTTRLLEHVLSPALAHELLFSGELRLGREFEHKTGVNYILPRDGVRDRALDVARRIAEKPRDALLMLKAELARPRRAAFASAVETESKMHAVIFAKPATLASIESEYLGDGKC